MYQDFHFCTNSVSKNLEFGIYYASVDYILTTTNCELVIKFSKLDTKLQLKIFNSKNSILNSISKNSILNSISTEWLFICRSFELFSYLVQQDVDLISTPLETQYNRGTETTLKAGSHMMQA